jgi:hypothetical protein
LLGVNLDVFDIGSIDEGGFFIKFRLRNKKDDFHWVLVAVYGAAQPEYKEVFLTELVQACSKEKLPLCVGVISISSEMQVRRIIIGLMEDGLFCLMLSLMGWT